MPEHDPFQPQPSLPSALLTDPSTSSHPPDSGAPVVPRAGPRFAPGELLADRYRVVRFLNRGGMGEVYEVEDLELQVRVALKTVRPERAASPANLQRFKREVLLSRSVTHPHVCRIYDLGRQRDSRGDVLFLTMELLSGETLLERIRRRGRLGCDEALPLVRQVGEALEAAHRAGVVHRDFKSSNVMVVAGDDGERAVVLDFGLAHAAAQALGEGREPIADGFLVGTPAYMAPEQVRGERTGPAADLYALGVVLFEMVTGRLPFAGETPAASALKRLVEDPPSPQSFVAIDPRWEGVILRLLKREPKERFARALEVARALEGAGTVDALVEQRHALPAERDPFVGREEELDALARRHREGARCLTVVGPPGAGKTRLVQRYGWRTLETWPGGVWFCDLTEARSLDGILSAVATSLDVPLGKGDPVVQLGHAIAGRGRCLVLLDNFEQVVEHAGATLGRWLERTREAAFVVTSRERLRLAGEEVVPLEPLEVEGTGVELFALRARAQRPDFAIGESNRETVVELVRLLDGLPLAIELAAARARVLTPGQIITRLRDRFALLAGGRGPAGRPATLKAAIDGSWELLQPWEKGALAQASVFEGGFTLEAAEEVLDLSPWPPAPTVLDVVQALVDKSLLRAYAPAREGASELDEPRFGMYVSVKEYAAEKLRADGAIPGDGIGAGAERQAEERHGRHYARYGTEEALEALDRHGGVERLRALGRDLENVIAACRRAIGRGDGAAAVATYRAAWAILDMRGPFAAGIDLGREVLGMPALDGSERAGVRLSAGRACALVGRMEEAREHHERALAVHGEADNRREQAIALGSLGNLHREQGRMEEARESYERALALHREVGNRRQEGGFLGKLGVLHYDQGRMDAAREHFEHALAIHREVGDRRSEGAVLGNLGTLHKSQGRMEEALDHYHRALDIHREVGHRSFEGLVLGNLGILHRDQGRMDEARTHLERALAIHREVGHRRFEGLVLGSLGNLHSDQGCMDEARDRHQQALAIASEVGDPRFEGMVLGCLAALHLAEGDLAGARERLARGEALLREVGDSLELGNLLCVRADLERRAGDLATARATLAASEDLAAQVDAGADSELGRKLTKLRQALAP